MHKFGCYSDEAKSVVEDLEIKIDKLCGNLEDTLLIVTADHGHMDGRNVSISEYPRIMECLVRMPSIEPRALNLFVKNHMKEPFEEEFNKEFGKDFILLTKEEAAAFKGVHAGYTREEMLIPLIAVLGKRRR